MSHTVNAVFQGGKHFSVLVNGHTVNIDASVKNGGNNKGPGAKIFMLVALAGCTGFDIVNILNKMRAEFSDLSIRVEASLTEAEPALYDEVTIHYSIKVSDENKPKMEKAVNLSKEKYCGVSKMFESFATVKPAIHFL